ncbi:MAG: Holliday junction branch migration protein RuvA [Bacteroidota bacterium]
MIAALAGKVVDVAGGYCLLEVNGVGYEVRVPLSALEELSQAQGEVRLFTYLHVREDAVQLFGFPTVEEKRVFERIISVSGIGPKTALSILSVLSVDRIKQAVVSEDHRLLASVPGIGQKTAQRLVLELRGKLETVRAETGTAVPAGRGGSEVADAVEALVALGYPANVAVQAVEAAQAEEGIKTAPTLVRAALKRMTR